MTASSTFILILILERTGRFEAPQPAIDRVDTSIAKHSITPPIYEANVTARERNASMIRYHCAFARSALLSSVSLRPVHPIALIAISRELLRTLSS